MGTVSTLVGSLPEWLTGRRQRSLPPRPRPTSTLRALWGGLRAFESLCLPHSVHSRLQYRWREAGHEPCTSPTANCSLADALSLRTVSTSSTGTALSASLVATPTRRACDGQGSHVPAM